MTALRVLIADDEALARSRLRTLLGQIDEPAVQIVAEAANGQAVLQVLQEHAVDVVLLDIAMPGGDGMRLAQALHNRKSQLSVQEQAELPAVVFVTAHAEHAVQAFEIEAVDYLTKPVRLQRLQAALQKAQRARSLPQAAAAELSSEQTAQQPKEQINAATATAGKDERLAIPTRHGTELVPVSQVMYFKAELKYVTVATVQRQYILDASLNELEQRFGGRFLRVHRNALVARDAISALLRPGTPEWLAASQADPAIGEDTWGVRIAAMDAILAVSRRQLPQVRELLQRVQD